MADRRRTRLTSAPADIIAAIPGLLGYVPSESIIAIGLDVDTVRLTARHDIAGTNVAAGHIAEVFKENQATTAVVIAVSVDPEVGADATRIMRDALRRRGIETTRRLHTPRCDERAPYIDHSTGEVGTTADYRNSPTSVGRIVDGHTIGASRSAMRACLATTDPIATNNITPQPVLAAKAVVSAIAHAPTDVPRELSAQVAVLIRDNHRYRDALLRTAAYDPITATHVFTELARPLRGRDRANVLTIAAAMHYLAGDGTMAGIVLDTIAAETPKDTQPPALARLLDTAQRTGMAPQALSGVIVPTASLADQLFGGHFPTPDDV